MIWREPSDQLILPDLLRISAERWPRSRHLSWREAGYWRAVSTEEIQREVRRFAIGLYALKVRPGATVGIVGASSPHWLIADLAALSIGAVTVPMFDNLADDHAKYEITHSRMSAMVVLGPDGWTFAAKHRALVPLVICHGVVDHPREIHGWNEVAALGDQLTEQDAGLYVRLREAVKSDALATIIFTSGSTGMPKGVELSHANLVSQAQSSLASYPLDPSQDRALSCLPLAHVFERMVAYTYLLAGIPVWFADDIKQAGALMREVRPTVMTMVPRLVEKIYDRVAQGIDASWVGRRAIGRWALQQAIERDPDEPKPLGVRISDGLVYQNVRAAMGGKMRYLIVGGAALEARFERFLRNIGVPVYTGYGLTEAGPVVSVNTPAARQSATVGKPYPGVEVRFTSGDEILVRGPGVMRGYHRDSAATAATIDIDGWLHTGDCGRMNQDGFLIITGRIKELYKTANGKYVCPIPIEQALSHSPMIDQICVIADGRPYVTALIFLTEDIMRRYTKAGKPDAELSAELQRIVEETNAGVDQWQQVRRWTIAPAPAVIGRELTPTLKLRRLAVAQQYRELIDTMYREGVAS